MANHALLITPDIWVLCIWEHHKEMKTHEKEISTFMHSSAEIW